MPFFAASPFLDALGWALLNSIWQFGVLWCLYYVLTAGIRPLTAAARHTLSVYLLLGGAGWFVASLSWRYYSQPAGVPVYTVIVGSPAGYDTWLHARLLADSLMPWWSACYLLCIAGLFLKFGLFVRQARQLQQKDVSKLPVQWRLYVSHLAALLGIKKHIKAVVSARVDTPQIIGFFKPVILIPLACLSRLSTQQMEAVLLHELVHVRRNDYLVNLFVASAEILFFFNPFVRQLVASLRRDREYSCDDVVLQFRYHPQQYAAALLSLEKERTAAVTFGIAASGRGQKQLLARVQRIMGIKTSRQLPRTGAYLVVAVLLAFIAMVNPVKIMADKISPMVVRFTSRSATAASHKEQAYAIARLHPAKAMRKQGLKKTAATIMEDNDDNTTQDDLQPVADPDGNDQAQMQEAVIVQSRDFSLPEPKTPESNETPQGVEMTPYVPNNSFSYHFVPDTSIPRIKGETFSEKQAREAMAKAKIALEQIDWRRIERDLKYNKRAIQKLKDEISKEIAGLNWQQINQQVQDQQKLAEIQRARAAYLKEQAIKQYQQNEAYDEAMRQKLMEQDQMMRDNEKHFKDQQKIMSDQIKKSEEDMKKKRIVYI